MTFDQFKTRVQGMFPIKFEDSLMEDQEPGCVERILREVLNIAFAKFEKIEGLTCSGTTDLPRAASVLKCIPTYGEDIKYDVFKQVNNGLPRLSNRPQWYFNAERKLIVEWNLPTYVEYVISPEYLAVEDLTFQYQNWCVKYAVAMLKMKEGYIGSNANLTALPFEFNYSEMKSDGSADKDLLDGDLDDMYFGLLAAKVAH